MARLNAWSRQWHSFLLALLLLVSTHYASVHAYQASVWSGSSVCNGNPSQTYQLDLNSCQSVGSSYSIIITGITSDVASGSYYTSSNTCARGGQKFSITLDACEGAPGVFAFVISNPPPPDSGGSGCFPSSAAVLLADGKSTKPMQHLEIGDRVMTSAGADIVYAFLDRSPMRSMPFVEITHEAGTLRLSPKHLVFVAGAEFNGSSAASGGKFLVASAVRPGDRVAAYAGAGLTASKVLGIAHTVAAGVYAPATMQGDLVIDGTLVSCYANVHDQAWAHFGLAPLRALYRLSPTLAATFHQENGMNTYAAAMRAAFAPFLDT